MSHESVTQLEREGFKLKRRNMRLTGAVDKKYHIVVAQVFFRRVSGINDAGKSLFTPLVCPPLLSTAFL